MPYLIGNCLEVLQELPDASVHCCVTSPPYYSHREYDGGVFKWPDGWVGQIGREPSPEMYRDHLLMIFKEVHRVLRSDGTLWLNLGDGYTNARGRRSQVAQTINHGKNRGDVFHGNRIDLTGHPSLKNKDLIGTPWRMAFMLQENGWWLRHGVVWHKPNCMPESITDRPTSNHEFVFMLTKAERYYYDSVAVLEPADYDGRKDTIMKGSQKYSSGGGDQNYQSRQHERWPQSLEDGSPARNKGSVWKISNSGLQEAHYAAFPKLLVEPCILASTSPRVCEHCGAPWKRDVEIIRGEPVKSLSHKYDEDNENPNKGGKSYRPIIERKTIGWNPTCKCENNTGAGKAIVLDPFGGSGTVGLVADEHGRDWVLIDASLKYSEIAARRMHNNNMGLGLDI